MVTSYRSLALGVLLVVCAPPVASAQTSRPLPAVGKHAVTFTLPDGGGAGFGIRRMRSATTNVGLEVQVGVSRHWEDDDVNEFAPQDRTTWHVGLRPDVRLYRRQEGPVIPFLEWSGLLGYRGATGSTWAVDISTGVGLGVEWFPLEGMSISGSTGFSGAYARTSYSGGESHLAFGGFRSALVLNLYF